MPHTRPSPGEAPIPRPGAPGCGRSCSSRCDLHPKTDVPSRTLWPCGKPSAYAIYLVVRVAHPLLGAAVLAQAEHAASAHLGRPWVVRGFTSLDDRASHPCGILHGAPFSVFAKLGSSAGAREEFTAELAGLRLVGQAAG